MTPEFIPSSVGATHSLRFGTEAPGSFFFLDAAGSYLPTITEPTCRWQSQHPAGWFNLTFSLFMTTDFFFSYPKANTTLLLRTWPKMKLLPTSDRERSAMERRSFSHTNQSWAIILFVSFAFASNTCDFWLKCRVATRGGRKCSYVAKYHRKRCKYFRALTPHIRELDMMSYGLQPQKQSGTT